MLLYMDEDVPLPVTVMLRAAGHDVLTASEAGMARRRIPDVEQLRFATTHGRTLITMNRNDFSKLHRRIETHSGIVLCSQRLTVAALGRALIEGFDAFPALTGHLLRVSAGGISLTEPGSSSNPTSTPTD